MRSLALRSLWPALPQAKGRVERNHGVYQDRFVKELRLENISTIKDANRFLAEQYLPDINERFAKPAIEPEDAHIALVEPGELNNVFCFQQQRVVSNDYVVQHEGRLYQLVKEPRKRLPEPGARVTVRRWLDGSVHIFWQNKELTVREITQRPGKEEPAEEQSA